MECIGGKRKNERRMVGGKKSKGGWGEKEVLRPEKKGRGRKRR